MKTALSSRRVLFVGSLLLLSLCGLWSLFDSEPESAVRANGGESEVVVTTETAELAATQTQTERAPVAFAEVAVTAKAIGGDSAADEPEVAVWGLIAQLELLAEEPESFHELALPVIEEVRLACAEDSVAEEILQQVVVEGLHLDLVRGAVLLGVSSRVSSAAFDGVFASWFGAHETSSELLRAAAVAAALRGDKSYCSLPLDLDYLARLQGQGNEGEFRLPGIYPLRIHRIPDPAQLDVLRGWIEDAERTASKLHGSSAAPDQAAIGEFFVAAELLFAVWGHAALQDAEVETVVLSKATVHEADTSVYLRVANFLVHSLAPCNDRMFDLSVQMAASEDPVAASLANSMSGHLSGGIGVALLSKIESVRYSLEAGSSAALAGYLLDVGDGLESIADPDSLAQAVAYIDGLIQDPMVDSSARSMGMMVLGEHASWDALLESASDVMQPGVPDELHAIALTSLEERAGSDMLRRLEVVAVLEEARGFATDEWVRSTLNATIENLSQ